MTTSTKKFTSFASLSIAVNAEKHNPEKWAEFLKQKGHTSETFNYLPEDIKTALKFSFAKKH